MTIVISLDFVKGILSLLIALLKVHFVAVQPFHRLVEMRDSHRSLSHDNEQIFEVTMCSVH